MAERLPVIRQRPDVVIDWWAHTGGSESVLAAVYPKARRLRVEPTLALTAPLNEIAPWWSAQRWRREAPPLDEAAVPPAAGQLLWANMMLHAVADPTVLMQAWRRALSIDGFLMFSTLGPDTLGPLRELYREAGWGPPHAPFTDMHDFGDMLVGAGFSTPVMDMETITVTYDSVDRLLADVQAWGGNPLATRPRGLLGRRSWNRFESALETMRNGEGKIPLTFEVIYGHAFRPVARTTASGEAVIRLDLRRK